MNFYRLQLEVPGSYGPQTIYDKSEVPWKLIHPHIIFEGWLGGQILNVGECLIVDNEFMNNINFTLAGITSYEFLFYEESLDFKILQPSIILPKFNWMKIEGKMFEDDLAMGKYDGLYNQLIISENAWNAISKLSLGNFKIEIADENNI